MACQHLLLALLLSSSITLSFSVVVPSFTAPPRFRRSSLGAHPCSDVPTQDAATCTGRSSAKTFGTCQLCPDEKFDDRAASQPRATRNRCCADMSHCITVNEVVLRSPSSFGLPDPVLGVEQVWRGRNEEHQTGDWQETVDLGSYTLAADTSFLHVSKTSNKDSILTNGLSVAGAGGLGGADQTHWAKNCQGYVYLWPMDQVHATIPADPSEMSEAQVSLFRNKAGNVKTSFHIQEKCSVFKVTLPGGSVLKADPDLATAVRFQGAITNDKVSLAWEEP